MKQSCSRIIMFLLFFIVSTNQTFAKENGREIAKDAARELSADGYYNKPGATRADYNRDWQGCRLIAQHAAIPLASGEIIERPDLEMFAHGQGVIGNLIGYAVAEGQMREVNCKACLLISGWRWIIPGKQEKKWIHSLASDEKSMYFDQALGKAETGEATVLSFNNDMAEPVVISPADEAEILKSFERFNIRYSDPVKSADVVTGPIANLGVIVVGFRRPDPISLRSKGIVAFARYDEATKTMLLAQRSKDINVQLSGKWAQAISREGSAMEYVTLALSPGEHVLFTATVPNTSWKPAYDFCMGTPRTR